MFECAVLERTTQVNPGEGIGDTPAAAAARGAADSSRAGKRVADVVTEGLSGPNGTGGEESGEYGLGADGGSAKCATGDDGSRSPAEGSHGGGFLGGIAEPLFRDGRLDFEDGVDALGRQVESGFMRKERRRVEVVEDGDVDLAGTAAVGIDDESGSGSVAAGEVAFEEIDPVMLGGGAGGGGMLEEAADGEIGEHLRLHAAEDFDEIDSAGVRFARHKGIIRIGAGSGRGGEWWW